MNKETLEKYDRQIRLWGVDGQKEIESAIVCALGSDVVNSEILKNMVLHAVGHVIIVDDAKVSEKDIGINFLVQEDCIGQNRADVVAQLLKEMNPDPEIKTIIKNPEDLSVLDDPIFKPKTIFLTYGNLSPDFHANLSAKIREKDFRQLHVQTTGFFGAIYLDAGSHYALEGGTDAESPNDFRIYKPFPELKEYLESYDITKMDKYDIEQLPFLVPLYWARQQYIKKTNETKISFAKAGELNKILTAFDPNDELETISQAISNSMYGCDPIGLPPNLTQCFDKCDSMPDEPFWKVVRAARDMYKEEGVPPHYGGIPDIECGSNEFQKLQEIYKHKGEEDAKRLVERCPDVDPEFVKKYAKYSWKSIGMVYQSVNESINTKYQGYPYEPKNFAIQILQSIFIASRVFVGKHNRVPTIGDEDEMFNLTKDQIPDANMDLVKKYIAEFCRFKGELLPSVAATLAAISAQEITKVIIRQATPMKGILIYDGVHGYLE